MPAAALAGTALALPAGISLVTYEKIFGKRFTTDPALLRTVKDFPGLRVKRCSFSSNRKQWITGYYYFRQISGFKGILIISHGFGSGGHNSYIDVANYFAANGYLVFCYDNTGTDDSEGRCVGGLPQALLDLDYAIRSVKASSDINGLPIVLFGHSWGGYAVANVLNYHPDVKAVVAAAGFNATRDIMDYEGHRLVGDKAQFIVPYLKLQEKLKFGQASDCTALQGFLNSQAKVMILQSDNDTIVPPCCGFDYYYACYKDDPRFTFKHYSDMGHGEYFRSPDAVAYRKEFRKQLAAFKESLGKDFTKDQKQQYIRKYLDKKRFYHLNGRLFQEILDFYDEAVAK